MVSVAPDGGSATVTTPARAAATVDVTVTTAGGSATLAGAYTFVAAPILTAVEPAAGPTSGGQTVTLRGTGLRAGMTVTVDGTPVTATVASATRATVVSPPHAAGPVDVSVATPGGTSTLAAAYEYVDAPTLTSVAPDVGPAAGGQSVTLTGTGLRPGMQVRFGTTLASLDAVDPTGTTATVTTPARGPGLVDVSVTTPGGSGHARGGVHVRGRADADLGRPRAPARPPAARP